MGNRRKSWHRALMEGTQTLTIFCALILLLIIVYNITHSIDAYEYYYLVGPVFLIGLFISLRYTLNQIRVVIISLRRKFAKKRN